MMLDDDILTAIDVFRSFSAQLSLCLGCPQLAPGSARRFTTSGETSQPYIMY